MQVVTTSSSVSLTQNIWTLLTGRNRARIGFSVQNTDTSTAVRVARRAYPWTATYDGAQDYIATGNEALLEEDGDAMLDETGIILEQEGSGDWVALFSGLTSGSIHAVIKLDAIEGSERTIVSFGDTNAATCLTFLVDTEGFLRAKLILSGVTQWDIKSCSPMTANKWFTAKLWHNGTRPYVRVDNKNWDNTDVTSTDLAAWFDEIDAGVDNCFFGALSYAAAGAADFFDGSIDRIDFRDKTRNDNPQADNVKFIGRWRFTEGTGTTTATEIDDYATDGTDTRYVGTFESSTHPDWASHDIGYYVGAGIQAKDESVNGDDPTLPAWGLSAGAGKSVTVVETERTGDTIAGN